MANEDLKQEIERLKKKQIERLEKLKKKYS